MVKASDSFPKNPAQHAADLMSLVCDDEDKQELWSVFISLETGSPKSIKCIQEDGASDEVLVV